MIVQDLDFLEMCEFFEKLLGIFKVPLKAILFTVSVVQFFFHVLKESQLLLICEAEGPKVFLGCDEQLIFFSVKLGQILLILFYKFEHVVVSADLFESFESLLFTKLFQLTVHWHDH